MVDASPRNATGGASVARRTRRPDAIIPLTIFVFVLIAIPARLVVGPLGSAGTPAEILGVALFGWYAVAAAGSPTLRRAVLSPIPIAMIIFLTTVLISYVTANSRPMLAIESHSADAGVLMGFSALGVMLTVNGGLASRASLDKLLRRIALGGGALATLGLVQFVTGLALVNYIQIPGLKDNAELIAISDRNGLARVAGTTLHPIEFGSVLTMCLPIGLHFALHDTDRSLMRRWFPIVAMGLAIPISISRSAILSTVVLLCFLMPTWSKAIRRKAYVMLVVLMGIVYLAAPGVIGTLTGAFTGIGEDSSAASRTDSYSLAWQYIQRTPYFGRGFQTFLPQYRILDNQYLSLLIGVGVIGTAAFLGLIITSMLEGWKTFRGARYEPNAEDRSLAISLTASIAAAALSFALFDGFSFPMAASLLFLILGCVGALRRFTREGQIWARLINA